MVFPQISLSIEIYITDGPQDGIKRCRTAMARVEEAIWTKKGASKRLAVQGMFAEIAPTYDRINGIISLALHHRWRRRAVAMLGLAAGDRALDVCCGTGDFMLALRKAVGARGLVLGVDFCEPMLQRARLKTASTLTLGDACALPVAAGQFDAVTVGWGIRNVPDIDAAHSEIVRVMKPGGRFVSLDMARPMNIFIRRVSEYVSDSVVPRIGGLFGRSAAYTYLPKSTRSFSTREELTASMQSAGMVDIRHTDLLLGNLCIHFARKPGVGST